MRVLGVEFGSWSVKAVEMESKFRRYELMDFHEIRLPSPATTTDYKVAIEQLFTRLSKKSEKIVASLHPSQAALRFLRLPTKQRKAVERMFRFELEDGLPFKLDESVVEHYVQKTADGSLVLAAVAPKRLVKTQIEWFNSTGLDPDWLTFDGMGVLNSYLFQLMVDRSSATEQPVLLLDIGHTKTNLTILRRDCLEFFRSTHWGGAAVTKSISVSAGISMEQAEALKITELDLNTNRDVDNQSAGDLSAAAAQAFAELIADTTQSLIAYRNSYGVEVASIQMTGGTSNTRGLDNLLSSALQLPVNKLDALGGLELSDSARSARAEASYCEAAGRALVLARKNHLLFNFRRAELAKETSLSEVTTLLTNPSAVLLLRFAALIALVLTVHVNVAKYIAKHELRLVQEDTQKAFSEIFPTVPSKLRKSITASPAELNKFLGQKTSALSESLKLANKTSRSALGTLLSISNAFPQDIKVDVNTVEIGNNKLLIEGVSYHGDLERVVLNLKANSEFKNIQLEKKDNRFTFTGEVAGNP